MCCVTLAGLQSESVKRLAPRRKVHIESVPATAIPAQCSPEWFESFEHASDRRLLGCALPVFAARRFPAERFTADPGCFNTFLMKAFPRCDLFQLVVDAQGLSEDDARPLFSQMLSCVRSLHNAGICHCDLGIESFPFASGTDQLRLIHMHSSHQYPWDARLGDFDRSSPPPQSRNVNYLYVPPENVCSFEADMWSLGVCLFAMLRNAVPVYDSEATTPLSAMLDNKCSRDLVDLVDGLLALQPQHRLTAREAAEHPWVLRGVSVTAISREMSDASTSLDSSQQQRKGFNCILCDASVPLRTRPGRRPRWYDNHFCSQACFDNSLAMSASQADKKGHRHDDLADFDEVLNAPIHRQDADDSAEREDDGEEGAGTDRLFTCKACDGFIIRKTGRGRRPNWYGEGYCSQECSSVG